MLASKKVHAKILTSRKWTAFFFLLKHTCFFTVRQLKEIIDFISMSSSFIFEFFSTIFEKLNTKMINFCSTSIHQREFISIYFVFHSFSFAFFYHVYSSEPKNYCPTTINYVIPSPNAKFD